MVRLLKQQRKPGHRPLIPLQKQPGDGINLHKDPLQPHKRPNLQKEPRPTSDRDRSFEYPRFDKVQDDLVPIGWGFYGTPTSEPIDPRDCNRWPNSLNCKLTSPNFGDLATSFEGFSGGGSIEVVSDECNIGISLQPGLQIGPFGIQGPQYQLVWRKEECRRAQELPFPNYPLPEPGEPWQGKEMLDSFADDAFLHIMTNSNNTWDTAKSRSYYTDLSCQTNVDVEDIGKVDLLINYTLVEQWTNWRAVGWEPPYEIEYGATERRSSSNIVFLKEERTARTRSTISYYPGKPGFGDYIGIPFVIFSDTVGGLATATKSSWIGYFDWLLDRRGVSVEIMKVYPFGKCGQEDYPLIPPPYPFPPPIGGHPLVPCSCPSPRHQRAILEQLNEINQKIGDAEFDVPETFVSTKDKPNPANVKINNLSDFLGYLLDRDDEFRGQWEIPIEIEDMEPFTEGNQKETIRLPNLAEAIADIWGAVTMIKLELGVTHQTAFRTMVSVGQNFQMIWQNQKKIDAAIEYIGFNYKEETEKIELLYNPFDETGDPATYLKNTEIEARKITFTPTDKRNLQKDLLPILHSAAVVRARFWRTVDKKDPKYSILRDVFSTILNRDNLKEDTEKQIKDFKQWLEDFEQGFPNWDRQTQGEYVEDFWGSDYSDRPRVQDITKSIEEENI